jgi:hypothetical protein
MEQCNEIVMNKVGIKYLVNNVNLRWVQYGSPRFWWWSNRNVTTTLLPNGLTRIADIPGVMTVKNNVNTYFIGKNLYSPSVGKVFNNTLYYAYIGFYSNYAWSTETFDVLTCLRRRKSQNETV